MWAKINTEQPAANHRQRQTDYMLHKLTFHPSPWTRASNGKHMLSHINTLISSKAWNKNTFLTFKWCFCQKMVISHSHIQKTHNIYTVCDRWTFRSAKETTSKSPLVTNRCESKFKNVLNTIQNFLHCNIHPHIIYIKEMLIQLIIIAHVG